MPPKCPLKFRARRCKLAGIDGELVAARILERRRIAHFPCGLPVFIQIPPRFRCHFIRFIQHFVIRLCHLNALRRYFLRQLVPFNRYAVVPLVQLPAQLFAELVLIHFESDIPLGGNISIAHFRHHKRVFSILFFPIRVQHLQAAYLHRLPHR